VAEGVGKAGDGERRVGSNIVHGGLPGFRGSGVIAHRLHPVDEIGDEPEALRPAEAVEIRDQRGMGGDEGVGAATSRPSSPCITSRVSRSCAA
jgi:hypothetical protein